MHMHDKLLTKRCFLMPLFLVFLIIPLIEIALFIQLGAILGLWLTIIIIFSTAFIGALLVRAQGIRQINQLRNSLKSGHDIAQTFGHGIMILLASVFLITPGFFTDGIGFLFLIPLIRTFLWRFLWRFFLARYTAKTIKFTQENTFRTSHFNTKQREETVNVEFEDVTEQNLKPHSNEKS